MQGYHGRREPSYSQVDFQHLLIENNAVHTKSVVRATQALDLRYKWLARLCKLVVPATMAAVNQ